MLKGAFVVMADLARHIRLPLEFDFMAVSSYGAATKTSGVVRILKDLDHDLEGMDVLVVEDIVDSGLTLKYLLKNLAARKPASLEVAALLRKTGIQQVELDLRYIGFDIPNEFVVGYGLDYAEKYPQPAVHRDVEPGGGRRLRRRAPRLDPVLPSPARAPGERSPGLESSSPRGAN